jgi:hypothetical protein
VNSKHQGAIGVGKAIAYYSAKGYAVFTPVADVSRFDLIFDTGDQLLRVEVKTTTSANGDFNLRTMGGNRSWTGKTVFLSADHCDRLFLVDLVTGVEREFTIDELAGRSTIKLRAL